MQKRKNATPLMILVFLLLTACQSTVIYTNKSIASPRKIVQAKPQNPVITQNDKNSNYMIASWYGNKFHGKKTASGEIYNMYDYTAAHRTLPFGTRLKLINEDNNKEAIVRINDRGPVPLERDIDVSYKTAQTLDFVNSGICKLKVVFLD